MKREIDHVAHHAPPPGGNRYATTGDIWSQAHFFPSNGNSVLNYYSATSRQRGFGSNDPTQNQPDDPHAHRKRESKYAISADRDARVSHKAWRLQTARLASNQGLE